eukprot:CAMPEP_0117445092 /NCGR_PEP_ID=MMETSP0759-20121206/5605_1 /TAXON_ID=63605 /ORGANISM="Percolomonas cosmopolitus, Strain WS" /LENGTH=50 /DNA_ID=CAMNT_0005237233 /DNA_START=705 /DNA_END=857 /DNA_ORIENTATION=-
MSESDYANNKLCIPTPRAILCATQSDGDETYGEFCLTERLMELLVFETVA